MGSLFDLALLIVLFGFLYQNSYRRYRVKADSANGMNEMAPCCLAHVSQFVIRAAIASLLLLQVEAPHKL